MRRIRAAEGKPPPGFSLQDFKSDQGGKTAANIFLPAAVKFKEQMVDEKVTLQEHEEPGTRREPFSSSLRGLAYCVVAAEWSHSLLFAQRFWVSAVLRVVRYQHSLFEASSPSTEEHFSSSGSWCHVKLGGTGSQPRQTSQYLLLIRLLFGAQLVWIKDGWMLEVLPLTWRSSVFCAAHN